MKKTRVFLLILLISISLLLASQYLLDTDYFWHIKAGEYMFNNGILTHDVFSWFMYGKYWMSHEWLFEIILYSLKLVFGDYHIIVYAFICLSLLFLILFSLNREGYSKNIFYTLLFLVLFVTMAFGFVQARPHLFSYSLLALTIYLCLDLYKNKDSKKIYFLPLITIVWANVHGGSSNLSYLLCGLFLVCGFCNFKLRKIESERISKKQIYRYLLVIILCMIGVCINIHGFKMFIYPYENILDTTMLKNIAEWQPTSYMVMYHHVYYVYLLFIIITMLISSKKIKLIDLMLLVIGAYLGLRSVRFWLYSPIMMSFIIFDYVKEFKVSSKIIYIFSGLIPIILGISIYSFINRNITYTLNISNDVVKIIEEVKPKRLFNTYDYGGELIYHNIPVFIDGRADLYSKYSLKDYFDVSNLRNNYEEIINKYNFDYLIVSKRYEMYNYFKNNPEYELIYKDKKLGIYKKTVN